MQYLEVLAFVQANKTFYIAPGSEKIDLEAEKVIFSTEIPDFRDPQFLFFLLTE